MIVGVWVFRYYKCLLQWPQCWSHRNDNAFPTWGRKTWVIPTPDSTVLLLLDCKSTLNEGVLWSFSIASYTGCVCCSRSLKHTFWASFSFIYSVNISLNVGPAVVSPFASCLPQLCLLSFLRWFSTPKNHRISWVGNDLGGSSTSAPGPAQENPPKSHPASEGVVQILLELEKQGNNRRNKKSWCD